MHNLRAAPVVLRSRFTEDRLCAAVRRGITQYIILGAGFDTFAFRQPKWANSLKIIEVDHPGTQTLKRSHIADSKLEIPTNVSFANIDFENESLLEGLLRQGISIKRTNFFFLARRHHVSKRNSYRRNPSINRSLSSWQRNRNYFHAATRFDITRPFSACRARFKHWRTLRQLFRARRD